MLQAIPLNAHSTIAVSKTRVTPFSPLASSGGYSLAMASNKDDKCPICLSPAGGELRTFLACAHWLHAECLDETLECTNITNIDELKCPQCKKTAQELSCEETAVNPVSLVSSDEEKGGGDERSGAAAATAMNDGGEIEYGSTAEGLSLIHI